jgi:hypothetical protein
MDTLTKLMTILLLLTGAVSAIQYVNNKYVTVSLGVLVAFCAIEIIRYKKKTPKPVPQPSKHGEKLKPTATAVTIGKKEKNG